MRLSGGTGMKHLVCFAVAVGLIAASPKPPSTYDELVRAARDAASEGLTSVKLNGRNEGGDPDSAPLRQRLLALCGQDQAFWQLFRQDAVRNTEAVASVTPGGNRPHDRLYGSEGKVVIAENFVTTLPGQVRALADTMPPAGGARFLRPDETLKARAADVAFALRQRAEWLVLVNGMTANLGALRDQAPRSFRAAYVLGLWSRVQCDLAQGDELLQRQLMAGYPAVEDGADTESAFLLLIGASEDRSLAARALAAAGQRQPAVSPQAIAALQRWSAVVE